MVLYTIFSRACVVVLNTGLAPLAAQSHFKASGVADLSLQFHNLQSFLLLEPVFCWHAPCSTGSYTSGHNCSVVLPWCLGPGRDLEARLLHTYTPSRHSWQIHLMQALLLVLLTSSFLCHAWACLLLNRQWGLLHLSHQRLIASICLNSSLTGPLPMCSQEHCKIFAALHMLRNRCCLCYQGFSLPVLLGLQLPWSGLLCCVLKRKLLELFRSA